MNDRTVGQHEQGCTTARFAAVLRTNISQVKCPEDLLKSFSDYLSHLLNTDSKNVILELHTNIPMIRAGTFDKAVNINIDHNSDWVNKSTKVDIAWEIACFMHEELQVDTDRTLVLFSDTRRC